MQAGALALALAVIAVLIAGIHNWLQEKIRIDTVADEQTASPAVQWPATPAVQQRNAPRARQPTLRVAGGQSSQTAHAPGSTLRTQKLDSVFKANQKLYSQMSAYIAEARQGKMQMATDEELARGEGNGTPRNQRKEVPANRGEGGGASTLMLRQYHDEGVPHPIDESAGRRIDLVGGALTLQPDMTFALRLDLRVQQQGGVSRASWQTSGRYRRTDADQLEFESPDFPDYGGARGLLVIRAGDDPPVVQGLVRPGQVLILSFGFTFAGITFGPDPYTFQ
jgi:hypothetical protein